MSRNHETVRVDGIELHYVREGEGFPLFLIHGWPEYWRVWRKNITALSDSFDVIVPDLAGFGDSENPAVSAGEGYGIEVPTRVLWGELDPIVKSEWADRLDEYFVDYRLDTVPDAGHFVHYERPELANEAIETFFTDLT